MKLTLIFAAAALAAPAIRDVSDDFDQSDSINSLADWETMKSRLHGGDPVKYSYTKDGSLNIVLDEIEYGWNNNCYVGHFGGKKTGEDGVERTDAWVVCMKAQRRLARDVRKVSDTPCGKHDVSSKSCTISKSETKSFEESVEIGLSLEQFTGKTSFKATQSKTESISQTFEQKCDGAARHRTCEVGGPALIEYDVYAGWVDFESWRYPEEEKGPQWLNAGDNYGGMREGNEMHQLYNEDAHMSSEWHKWKLYDDDCNLVTGKYASNCQTN
ncbi:hypothetical protein DICA0_E20252 [Diutina catenulata]